MRTNPAEPDAAGFSCRRVQLTAEFLRTMNLVGHVTQQSRDRKGADAETRKNDLGSNSLNNSLAFGCGDAALWGGRSCRLPVRLS